MILKDLSNGQVMRNQSGNLVSPHEYQVDEIAERANIPTAGLPAGSSCFDMKTQTFSFWNGFKWVDKEA